MRKGLDLQTEDAVPYFNWDVGVTNGTVRAALRSDSIEDRVFWVARIMSEARYDDVWAYLSLDEDVLPLWSRVRPQLGRRRDFWEFLLGCWRQDGLIDAA